MSTTSESYLVGLIGDGITRSLTPPMHETEARNHGLHYLYRPVDLEVIGRPGEDVGELLRAGRDLGPTPAPKLQAHCGATLIFFRTARRKADFPT